jgi:hypothetical protein
MHDKGGAGDALRALERYRERSGGRGQCLIDRAQALQEEATHRRAELVEREVGGGLDRAVAEEVYDLAREEGLDPLFAFALAECGVAVRVDPAGEPDAPQAVEREPDWIRPVDPVRAERELTLRRTFRRLRALLESHASPEEALRAFAAEPDVGPEDYNPQDGGA